MIETTFNMITRHGFGEIKHPKPFLNYLIPLVKVSNKERKKERKKERRSRRARLPPDRWTTRNNRRNTI